MSQSHYLLKGTFCLTAAGVLSRISGFFYKIFLSRTIGAEEIGLFHLCIPVCTFCMAACAGGIQTALSRFTAQYMARKDPHGARRILLASLLLSLGLALPVSALLFGAADLVAETFLAEERCAPLLRILACSLPFGVTHACVCGYFIGKKNVTVPAVSQLAEQFLRITGVLFFYLTFRKSGAQIDAAVMALGQIAGELASSLLCLYFLVWRDCDSAVSEHDSSQKPSAASRFFHKKQPSRQSLGTDIRTIFAASSPLAANRMLLCVLQAIEAALLPQQLARFGTGSSDALAMYGILSGMALPLLFFPTAVTGSVGTLLLPLISEANTRNQEDRIHTTSRLTFEGSLLLGLLFLSLFFVFGRDVGTLLFGNPLAGDYIRSLSLTCPFLYINTTLISILHGIGKTTAASVQNSAGFLLRLLSVVLLVPSYGMNGYFLGTLISQAAVTALTTCTLCRSGSLRLSLTDDLLKPVLLCILTVASVLLLRAFVPFLAAASWLALLAGALLCCLIFLALSVLSYRHAGR